MEESKEFDSYSDDVMLLTSTLYADVMEEFKDCIRQEIMASDVRINMQDLNLDGNSIEELVNNYLRCEEELELLSSK